MKPVLQISIFFLLITSQLYSQLKYEGAVDSRYKTFQLDDGSLKYVKYNKKEEKVQIYKLNDSLWKTIKLPLPNNHLLEEIKHISIKTINDDDHLELIYSCVIYDMENENIVEDGIEILQFTLNIINENGEIILKVPNSNEMEIIESNGKKKLLVYKHIGQHFSSKDQTLVYSLK